MATTLDKLGEHRGTIEVTDDVLTIAPEAIHPVTAAKTIVGGRVGYSRD